MKYFIAENEITDQGIEHLTQYDWPKLQILSLSKK